MTDVKCICHALQKDILFETHGNNIALSHILLHFGKYFGAFCKIQPKAIQIQPGFVRLFSN